MSDKIQDWVLRYPTKTYDGFEIMPNFSYGFDLDVDYDDNYYGTQVISLDAIDVYQKLKEYFKGTPYE